MQYTRCRKLYMFNDTISKYNSFRFKTWVCMRLDFLTSNFNALVKFRVGLEYAHTHTHTKTILFKTYPSLYYMLVCLEETAWHWTLDIAIISAVESILCLLPYCIACYVFMDIGTLFSHVPLFWDSDTPYLPYVR